MNYAEPPGHPARRPGARRVRHGLRRRSAPPPGTRAAAAVVGAVSGLVGGYDDLAGARPEQARDKGLAGHLAALRAGPGLGRRGQGRRHRGGGRGRRRAHPARTRRRRARRRRADHRPGRRDGEPASTCSTCARAGPARPACSLAAATLGGPAGGLVAGPLGATLAVLPDDLGERVMLGDCGANALGALLGLRLAVDPGPRRRAPACSPRVVGADPGQREGQLHDRSSRPRPGCANWTGSAAGRRERAVSGASPGGSPGAAALIAVAHRCWPGSPASAARWSSPTPSAPTAPATPTWPPTPSRTSSSRWSPAARWPASSSRCSPAGIAAGDREQVRRTASALLGWTLLVLTPLAVAGRAGSPSRSPGCCSAAASRAEVALAARFLLVFAPQVVLYGIGIVLAGVLQAHRRFAGPALAPLLSSLVVAGGLPALRRHRRRAGDVGGLSTPAELVLGVGTTLGRGGAEPEPARAAAPAAAGAAAGAALPGRAPRRGCAGWPWPGC